MVFWANFCEKHSKTKPFIGVSSDGKYHISCTKCHKHHDFTDEETKMFNERNETCDVCHQELYHSLISQIGKFDGKRRGFMNNQFIELNEHNHKEPLEICEGCINMIGYKVLPKFIYCDLCHSEHTRVFGSDTQGEGLCGEVLKTGKHQGYIGWWACRDETQRDTYIVDCQYGSGYDTVGEYDICFVNNQLPDNIHVGMNLCDECIGKLIETGVLTDPTKTNPERFVLETGQHVDCLPIPDACVTLDHAICETWDHAICETQHNASEKFDP
jgi:hypothetical protein